VRERGIIVEKVEGDKEKTVHCIERNREKERGEREGGREREREREL